jgi:hypothetical protein
MFVITGLVPVIHGSYDADIDRSGVPWMAGSSPAMTIIAGVIALCKCLQVVARSNPDGRGSSPRMTLPAVLHLCCI